jgi:phage shock protein A
MSLIERAEQIAAAPMDAAQEEERLRFEIAGLHRDYKTAAEERTRLREQLEGAVDRIAEMERELARGGQRFANEEVRQMRRTGFCPCCGAEDPRKQ